MLCSALLHCILAGDSSILLPDDAVQPPFRMANGAKEVPKPPYDKRMVTGAATLLSLVTNQPAEEQNHCRMWLSTPIRGQTLPSSNVPEQLTAMSMMELGLKRDILGGRIVLR